MSLPYKVYYFYLHGSNTTVTLIEDLAPDPMTNEYILDVDGQSQKLGRFKYTFEIVPKEGYKLEKVEAYMEQFGGVEPDASLDVKINPESTKATGTFRGRGEDVHVTVTVYEDSGTGEPSPILGTFNRLYLVDRTRLHLIAGKAIGKPFEEPPPINQFIINLLYLPFKIPESMLYDFETVKIGFETIGDVQAKYLVSDNITIDIGKIEIPEKFGNVYDYVNTDVNMHLPYCPRIELLPEYTIGHIINIEYVVNLYTGETTVNIYSDKTGKVFHSENFNVGSDIPLIRKQGKEMYNSQDIRMSIYNKIRTAYVEVIRNRPYNETGQFNNQIQSDTKLINESGFVIVDDIKLDIDGTSQESQMIKNILRSGVFINGQNR